MRVRLKKEGFGHDVPFQADIQQGQEGAITTAHAAWKWKLWVALIEIFQ